MNKNYKRQISIRLESRGMQDQFAQRKAAIIMLP